VSEYDDANCGSEPADPVSTLARNKRKATQDFVSEAATIGVIATGAALFEVALIPGIAIGAATALAPKLRRHLWPLLNSMVRGRIEPASARPNRPDHKAPLVAPAGIAIKQALPKTVTFQIIGTTVDFTAHYVVVGNLTTAVSLSASHLLVRPLYYLVHEAAWNYLGPPAGRKVGLGSNRALAKTVTYQVMATALDFTTHYVVVGSLGTAASLSAIGFVVSPFVYFGHEIAWDYYGSWARRLDPLTRKNLVPEPG
jgi:uncharacterized membrane protein